MGSLLLRSFKGPVQESGGETLEREDVSMEMVGISARTPKPGIAPRAELRPPMREYELRPVCRVLAALARVLAISSNAFSTYIMTYEDKVRDQVGAANGRGDLQ